MLAFVLAYFISINDWIWCMIFAEFGVIIGFLWVSEYLQKSLQKSIILQAQEEIEQNEF